MATSGETKAIVIFSPVGGEAAVYKWPLTYVSKGQKIDRAEEIVETIRWVAREYQEFKSAIENIIPAQPNFKSYECIKEICDRYNRIIDKVLKLRKGTSLPFSTLPRASQGLLKHIIQQVYNDAVEEPAELNKYSPFSSETYGETSFEFMAQLIEKNQFRPREQDTFIDLGSGVGHLVLQMAATLKCKKCYGIEIADVPAGFAEKMQERFIFWMDWYGKTYTEFELIKGDFFDQKYVDIIKSSTHILVNNFAFKPDVDHRLKEKFLDLTDGTQILSSKPFCSPKNRLTERHLSDLGSIMHVLVIQPDLKKDTVSWTTRALPYYLHVLDGSRIEKYYERQKRRQGRSQEKGKVGGKRRKTERGSESLSDDSEDNTVYGPTTRKAWSEWCNASSITSCNRASTDSAKTSLSRNNSTDTENLNEEKIEEAIPSPVKEPEPLKIEKRSNSVTSDKSSTQAQEIIAQAKAHQTTNQAAKSCLDKKRDYAIKKGGANTLQDAPPSTLYSISKPADATNGATLKIPNIVIKFKPTTEAKVLEGTSKQPTEVKEPDENGKKLRQRKTVIKPDSKTSNPVPITSGIKGTRATKKPTVPKGPATKSTAATKKKATSPEKNSSLEFLHAKTVESVTTTSYHAQPAPGCEDHKFGSIIETPSLPRVVIKDLSMYQSALLGQKNLDSCMLGIKQGFERFAQKISQPNAGLRLEQAIEAEKQRKDILRKQEIDLEKQIEYMENLIARGMKRHCDEFGIHSSRDSLMSNLGILLRKNQDLSRLCAQLEAAHRPQIGVTPPGMTPPLAHSNSGQPLHSPYRNSGMSATLDLSIKQST